MRKKLKEVEIVLEAIADKDIKKGDKIRIKISNMKNTLEVTGTNRGKYFLNK